MSKNSDLKKLKIIDFSKKGNVVRFYLGKDDENDYWGDDWNDRPYECNAGEVYGKFVDTIVDIAFPYDCCVLEPSDGYRTNSSYSKEDMQKGLVPCLVIVPKNIAEESWYTDNFDHWVSNKDAVQIYFNDKITKIEKFKSLTIYTNIKKEVNLIKNVDNIKSIINICNEIKENNDIGKIDKVIEKLEKEL